MPLLTELVRIKIAVISSDKHDRNRRSSVLLICTVLYRKRMVLTKEAYKVAGDAGLIFVAILVRVLLHYSERGFSFSNHSFKEMEDQAAFHR